MSLLLIGVFFRDQEIFLRQWFFYFVFFFLVGASHGILDAFTSGGLGIALLSPFNGKRYFFPRTPIQVSPIGVKAFFGYWGLIVIKSELLWIWLPSFLVVIVSKTIRGV